MDITTVLRAIVAKLAHISVIINVSSAAGDHVKFGFPMAAMTTVVAWSAVDYALGYSSAGKNLSKTYALKSNAY